MRWLTVLVAVLSSVDAYAQIHLNKIIAKLDQNEIVIGTWCMSISPYSAIGLVRFNEKLDPEASLTTPMIDFVLIDMEHLPFDSERLLTLLMAFQSKRETLEKGDLQPSISPLVRIPCDAGGPIEPYIKQVLDMGAYGVVVPHCSSAADAERVVSACRYPQPKGDPQPEPPGRRGASPWLCSYLWGLTMEEYVQRADVWPLDPSGDILAVVMIEDMEGKENIDEILSVPGIGAVIFGPYDFSFSCGAYGNTQAPEVEEARREIKEACDRHNVPLIGLVNEGNIDQMLTEGYRILLSGSDTNPDNFVVDVIEKVKQLRD